MNKLAYTYEEAGEATGYSGTVIKRAVRDGDLSPSYANAKPVIREEELRRWLASLPAEPKKKPGSAATARAKQ